MIDSYFIYTIHNLESIIVHDDQRLYIDVEEIGKDELEDYVIHQLGHLKIPKFGNLEKSYDHEGLENGKYFMILQIRDDEYVRKKIEVFVNKAIKAMLTRVDELLTALYNPTMTSIVTRRLLRRKEKEA